MKRRMLALIFGATLALSMAPAAAGASAPVLLASDPEDGEVVHEAPARVTMTFSEPLASSSEIQVFDECRRRVDDGTTSVSLNEMSVGITKTPSGVYVAGYVAKGPAGATGESSGQISFTVHSGASCDGSSGGHDGHGGGGGSGKDHDGHGGGGGSGKDHDGHGGGGSSGTHGGHGTGSSSHPTHGSSGAHSSTHAAGSGDHAGHGGGNGKGGKGHRGHGKNKGGGHDDHADDADGGAPVAAPGDPLPPADGQAVLLALGVSLLIGAGGGLIVRIGFNPFA